jgi:hypothetical protein
MMKTTLILSLILTLSGCATGCREACVFGFGPGNSTFDTVAKFHNDQDPCILKGKPIGTVRPDFCGASNGMSVRINAVGYNRYMVDVK